MARRRTSKTPGDTPTDAAEWLEEGLDDGLLDLDVLAAMPLADVEAALHARGADDAAFKAALRARLGDDAAPAGGRPNPMRARAADRSRSAGAAARPRKGLFSLRNALIVSAVIVVAVLFGPLLARRVADMNPPEPAVVIAPPEVDIERIPPTRLEGPSPAELVRGVRYTLEGLVRVATDTPLPPNPGDLSATFQLRMRVDAAGNVVSLESLLDTTHPFESVVVDSLLRWRFERDSNSPRPEEGTITITYQPEG